MIRRHYPPHAARDQTGRGAESRTMRSTLLLTAAAIVLGLVAGGCVYRVNIPQGNYLEAQLILAGGPAFLLDAQRDLGRP